jgi:OmpA-OmpF porin, OOP family
MKKFFIAVSVVILILVGCAAKSVTTTPSEFDPQAIDLKPYELKVDNFVILHDASQSLHEKYKGRKKFDLVKELAARMGRTLPEMDVNGGLRTFGHGWCGPREDTQLIYGMEKFSPNGYQAALDTITCAGGNTPLAAAIEASGDDLSMGSGKMAVIALSDGTHMIGSPVEAVQELKGRYGDNLCFYSVIVGDDPDGAEVMTAAAEAGGCGFAVNADAIYDATGVADFIVSVFFDMAKMAPADSDGDGVPDSRDDCPNTPKGVAVDERGCPLDTDGDGVADYQDKCPGTPVGAHVNSVGCWVVANIEFAFDKWNIEARYFSNLDDVARVMMENPNMKAEIQGHTDNIGSAKYNQKLSEKRARAVVDYLVKKGISADMLSSKGYGFSKSVASNETPEGRQQNRRVEIMPIR